MPKAGLRLHAEQDNIHSGAVFVSVGECRPLKRRALIFFPGDYDRSPGIAEILALFRQRIPVVKPREIAVFKAQISLL